MNSRQKLITYVGIGLLLVAIPVTIFISQRRQQLQSDAALEPPPECRVYADIALVVDMSTSMDASIGGVTKKTAAIEALRAFINSSTLDLEGNNSEGRRDRIGIVQFSNNENVRTISELSTSRSQLLSSLSNLRTEEGTSINKGLVAGRDLLLRGGTLHPNQERRVLLLSDGAINILKCDPNKPSCNDHLGDPDRADQLAALRRDATLTRQTADILAIYFGSDTGAGLSQLQDHVVDDPSKVIHANLTQGEITNAFLDAARLFTECPCSITTIAQVRDATTNQLINLAGFGYDNNQGFTEAFPSNNTELGYTWDAPTGTQNSANVSLNPINNGYTIDSTFCYNNETGNPDGCPPGMPQGGDASNKGPAQVTISNLNVACEVNMTYGWRVKKKDNVCTNSSAIEIRERDPNTGTITLLDGVPGFSTTSFIRGEQQGGAQEILEGGVNRKAFTNVSLPKSLEFTKDTRVDLDRQSAALNYKIVSTFCEENKTALAGTACTPDVGHSRESLENFTLLCDSDITYGWVVERVPTDALCYNLTCQDKQDLVDQGAPVNTLIPCTVDQIGTQPDICDANVCNSNLVCERVAVEDATPGTIDECANIGEACPRPKNVCDQKACITVDNPNDPRYNNKTCTTLGNSSIDCTVTVCDTDDTCKEFAEDDPYTIGKEACDINDPQACVKAVDYYDCDYDAQICVTKTAQDGVVPPEAVDCSEDVSICQSHYACSPERTCEKYGGPLPVGTESCDTDKDCLPKTAYVCDLSACVEKFIGDKQPVKCADPAEGEFCECDPDIPNICEKPEDPDTGVNGAALAITVMALGIFIAGLRLIF